MRARRYDAGVNAPPGPPDAQAEPGTTKPAPTSTALAERRARRKANRRAHILAVALASIEERGLKGATFELIASRAGVSRGTVFNYFPTKESMLVAYFGEQLELLALRLRRRRRRAGFDGLSEIAYLFDELADFVAGHHQLILPISFELLDPNEERSRAAFLALPLVPLLRDAIRRAQGEGGLRSDHSPERLARTLANVYFITALQWAAYRRDRSVHEEFRLALKLSLEGMCCAGAAGSAGPAERAPAG